MKIYESEINDGLGDVLSKETSIACCGIAETYKPETSEEEDNNLKKVIMRFPLLRTNSK